MKWNRLQLNDADGDAERASVLSRREALAKLGLVGAIAVVGPALLRAMPAEAAPAGAQSGDALKKREPEVNRTANADARPTQGVTDGIDTEFSSQRWRRRRWRRRWRRRVRVVCRRRWRRGRLIRVCRRVWW